MRVLHVSHYPVYGGPHNQVHAVARRLREMGVETLVAITDEPGNAADRLERDGLDVTRLPLNRIRATRDPRPNLRFVATAGEEIRQLSRLIRRKRVDVVSVSGLLSVHGAIAARRVGVPTVWQIVDTRSPPILRRSLTPLIERTADALMFNGQALVGLHSGKRGPRLPYVVYPAPVDTTRFAPDPARGKATRERLGVPLDAPWIGTIANLTPMKGVEYFIRAAALIHRVRPKSWFLICGSSPESHRAYRTKLHDEICRSQIPRDRFIMTEGFTEDYYPALDVKVIASVPRSEGTTTTAIEAMACAVPVVAARVGAVAEVVADNETGYVVPPLDPYAIADAVLRLLHEPRRARRFGVSGRIRAVKHFDASICAGLHLEAFEAALAHRRISDGSG